jgi:hypothetical protein
MKQSDLELYNSIKEKLDSYKDNRALPGIANPQNEYCFIRQIVDSVKRVKFAQLISQKVDSPISANPSSIAFDPLKAAVWYRKQGNINEAFWLVFLATHFGKNLTTKWNLVKDVYSGLTDNVVWSWQAVCENPDGFRAWLNYNEEALRARGKVGNHRKYQSLGAYNHAGTGEAISSYIDWVGQNHNHQDLIDNTFQVVGNDSKKGFRLLYNSMNAVMSFGRMARFDYLTMVGKLGLINIVPDSAYIVGATGPVKGARILFGQNVNNRTFDQWLNEMDEHLELDFGMQVLEDAICNWQKNISNYKHFKG